MCCKYHPDVIDNNRKWLKEHDYFIRELRNRGINLHCEDKPHELIGTEHEPAYIEAVLASLDYMPTLIEKYRFAEFLMNSTKAQYDPSKLIELYHELDDPVFKGDIVGTLAQTNPVNVGDWFVHLLLNEKNEEARTMVASYVGFSPEYPKCRDVLIEHFADFPAGAICAFERAGGEAELELLKSFDHENANVKEEHKEIYLKRVREIIQKLEKRVERQRKRDERRRLKAEEKRKKKGK
jgi:hypothetical protein